MKMTITHNKVNLDEVCYTCPINCDQSRIEVRETIAQMHHIAVHLEVDNEKSFLELNNLYKGARQWKKIIEDKRKELIDPFRQEQSKINDKAKEISDPLDEVIRIANSKTNQYQKMLENKKRAEEEKIREAARMFDIEEAIYIAPLEKMIRGDGVIATTKTVKKYRVTDLKKVPLRYLMVNERAVELEIKLGINSIEGIEIYEETITNLRIR
jgi:hypothetical protein